MDKAGAFSSGAQFYDAVYSDKESNTEVDRFLSASGLGSDDNETPSVLEIGVGTGRHARILAQRGFNVLGIDQSQEMLDRVPNDPRISVMKEDGRSFDLQKSFDCVFAFFHVFSYFTTDEDVDGLMTSVRKHLKPGKTFVFDAWFTPGVYAMGSQTRVKEAVTGDARVIRISNSREIDSESVIEVTQRFLVWDLGGTFQHEFTEVHRMRHFSEHEIRRFAASHGFRVKDTLNPGGTRRPDRSDWASIFTLIVED